MRWIYTLIFFFIVLGGCKTTQKGKTSSSSEGKTVTEEVKSVQDSTINKEE